MEKGRSNSFILLFYLFGENYREQLEQQHDIGSDNRVHRNKPYFHGRTLRRACTHTSTLGGRQDTPWQHGQGTSFFHDNYNGYTPRDGDGEDLVTLMEAAQFVRAVRKSALGKLHADSSVGERKRVARGELLGAHLWREGARLLRGISVLVFYTKLLRRASTSKVPLWERETNSNKKKQSEKS